MNSNRLIWKTALIIFATITAVLFGAMYIAPHILDLMKDMEAKMTTAVIMLIAIGLYHIVLAFIMLAMLSKSWVIRLTKRKNPKYVQLDLFDPWNTEWKQKWS